MTEAEARAMTDQPVTAPTSGPWTAQQCGIYAGTKLIACTGDDGDETNGQEQLANARLIAAAPETAAERDRLLVVNEGLVKVLEKMMAGINAMRHGDIPPLHEWQEVWDEALAALDAARQL